jgi:hypothetical protein
MTARKETMSARRLTYTVTVVLMGIAGSAQAADWSFDPKVTLNLRTDDNNRMTDVAGEEINVSGAELDAQLTMRAETPRSSFSLIPRLRSTMYPGDEQDETDDLFLRLAWEHRGERSTGSLGANYSQITTLGSFFPGSIVPDDGELGEPGRGETVGKATGQNNQERAELSPRAAFQLTQRTALEIGVGLLDVNYDQQVADDREDYSDLYGSAGLRFKTSPTTTLAIVAGAARFEPDSGSSIDSQFLNAEWSNQISQTSQVFVRGGVNRVKSDSTGGSSWNTGFDGGAGVRWAFEVTQVFADLNHYLDPSSFGRVIERDQLRFQLSRRLGPLTTLRLAARGIRDGDTGADGSFKDRKYTVASVDLEWRMTRQFAISGGYDYAWRKYDGEPNDAVSNALHLGITYEPHRL